MIQLKEMGYTIKEIKKGKNLRNKGAIIVEINVLNRIQEDFDREILKSFTLNDVGTDKEQKCLEILSRNGELLESLKEQTPALCEVAIRQTVKALAFVQFPTVSLFRLAIEQTPFAIKYLESDWFEDSERDELMIQALKKDPSGYAPLSDSRRTDPIDEMNFYKPLYGMAIARQSAKRLFRIPAGYIDQRVLLEMVKEEANLYKSGHGRRTSEEWMDEIIAEMVAQSYADVSKASESHPTKDWEKIRLFDAWTTVQSMGSLTEKERRYKGEQLQLQNRWRFFHQSNSETFWVMDNEQNQTLSLTEALHQTPQVFAIIPYTYQTYRLARYAMRLNNESETSDELRLAYFSRYHVDEFVLN